MRQTSNPNTSVYLVASIAFSFLPPWVARVLAIASLLCVAGITALLMQGDGMVFGIVQTVLPPGALPDQLAEIQTIAFESTITTLRLPLGVADQAALDSGDLVFALGLPETIGSFPLVKVSAALTLPLAEIMDRVAASFDWLNLADLHPAGVILVATAMAIFARTSLRLVAAATLAPVFAILAFVGQTYNLSIRFLPLPANLVEPATIMAAIIGAVVGYKALIRDPSGIGERLAAVVLGLMLAPVLAQNFDLTLPMAAIAAITAAVGLLFPVAMPILTALLMANTWIPLDPIVAGAAGFAALVWHLMLTHRHGGGLGQRRPDAGQVAQKSPFTPAPDDRGEFPLHQIITAKQEG